MLSQSWDRIGPELGLGWDRAGAGIAGSGLH